MHKVVSTTKYNRKQYKAFYEFHLLHRSGSMKFLVLMACLMLFMALFGTFNKDFTLKENKAGMIFGWLMFAFTLMIAPLMIIIRVNGVVRKETREILNSTEKIEVNKIKFIRSCNAVDGKLVFGWNDIDVIYETNKYFYIYLKDDNGIFIVKSDIVEGDAELFRKLAEANLKKDKHGKLPYKRCGKVRKMYKKAKKEERKASKNVRIND